MYGSLSEDHRRKKKTYSASYLFLKLSNFLSKYLNFIHLSHDQVLESTNCVTSENCMTTFTVLVSTV
jgi:hypothetical protein